MLKHRIKNGGKGEGEKRRRQKGPSSPMRKDHRMGEEERRRGGWRGDFTLGYDHGPTKGKGKREGKENGEGRGLLVLYKRERRRKEKETEGAFQSYEKGSSYGRGGEEERRMEGRFQLMTMGQRERERERE